MNKAPFTKDTLTKIAACNALGLEYWSPGPKLGLVWALDGDRQAHLVRVRSKQATVCKAILSEPVPFEVTESTTGGLVISA